MFRIALTVTTAVLLTGSIHAQSAPATDTVKSEIRALMTDLNAALVAKDRTALERIYADEFLFVHALGVTTDKKGQIETAMNSRAAQGYRFPRSTACSSSATWPSTASRRRSGSAQRSM